MEHESDGDTNCDWCTQHSRQRIGTGTGGLEDKRTSGDHPNNSVVEIGQNIAKSPKDLKRLAVNQTPVEKPSANAGVKNSKDYYNHKI